MSDAKVNGPTHEGEGEAPQAPPAELPPPSPEEIITPEVVDRIIKGYNTDCELVDFSAKLGTKVGDNYMSIMYAVEINVKNRKTGEAETLNVMAKTMPKNPMRQQMINESGAFIKESKIYEDVIPRMVAFQKEKGLKDDELFLGWPQCFATFNDGTNDYLGMEDMRVQGYKMANRLAGLDMEHAQLVLKNVARYHALSFAIFRGDYDLMMETYPWLEEKMFPSEDKVQEPMKMWMKSMFTNEADSVRKEGHIKEADLMEKMIEGSIYGMLHSMLGQKTKNPVINHGDCWTNNMLFLYDDDNKPRHLKFVDFQMARCSPRSIDLGYFLHSSLPIGILNEKEEYFLKLYHDEFIRFVTRLGVEPLEYGLTWEEFMDEYKNCKFFGVVMGFMLAPILSADAADVPDMENLKEEDFGEDGAKDFMNQLMGTKSDSIKKICNLAIHHLPRCPQMMNK